MRLIKCTGRHKFGTLYAGMADYIRTAQDISDWNCMYTAFERCYGPPRQLNKLGDWVRNPRWYAEAPQGSHQRRRIYFQSMKDWQWALLAK